MRPSCWPWFLFYCFTLVFVYFLCFVGGIAMLYFGSMESGADAFELMLYGGMLAGMGLPLMLGVGVAPFLPPKKWVWVYDLLLIAMGMGSCLWLPLSLFLLLKWIEPDVKDYFGA